MPLTNLDFHTQLFPYLANCKLVFFQVDWTTLEKKNKKQPKKKKKKKKTNNHQKPNPQQN